METTAIQEVLIEDGVISRAVLERVLADIRGTAVTWLERLVMLGQLDEAQLCESVSRTLHAPACDPRKLVEIPRLALEALPPEVAIELRALPLALDRNGDLKVAVATPFAPDAWAQLCFFAGDHAIKLEVVGPTALAWGLHHYYGVATPLWPPPTGTHAEPAWPRLVA